MKEDRAYQQEIIGAVWKTIDEQARRVLMVLPTGGGKTVIASDIIGEALNRTWRVLILVHRRELATQMSRKLHSAQIDHGIIQAGFTPRTLPHVQVASVQTLHARAIRSERMSLPRANLIVVDEAHHIRARTWGEIIIEAYPDAAVLGLTATPCRGDGRGLGGVFEALVEGPDVKRLTELGHLVPAVYYAPYRPDLKGVKVSKGDYAEGQLAEKMDRADLVGDIVTHWLKLAEHRRTVVFATSVAHSVHIRDSFRAAGVMAEHIDGATPVEDRDKILAKFAAGTVEVVSNCMVLTEGFDCPEIGCIVMARPTKHMGLYRQMLGRGLRAAAGKSDCLVLDHAGAVFEHGFADEPVTWTLKEDKKAENRKHRERSDYQGTTLVACPECQAVRMSGSPCPSCGWRPQPKPQAVQVGEGELAKVSRDGQILAEMTAMQKRSFHAQLLWIAYDKGYKPGWAAFKFKEKFHHWPAGKPEPMQPEPAVKSWVRSRQIAYAKAREQAA
jgi:superfamily II DNA or RNA helicase